MSDLKTVARVQMIVEVELAGYGSEWVVAAVMKDAEQQAVNLLMARLKNTQLRIHGTPKVTAVFAEKQP